MKWKQILKKSTERQNFLKTKAMKIQVSFSAKPYSTENIHSNFNNKTSPFKLKFSSHHTSSDEETSLRPFPTPIKTSEL